VSTRKTLEFVGIIAAGVCLALAQDAATRDLRQLAGVAVGLIAAVGLSWLTRKRRPPR